MNGPRKLSLRRKLEPRERFRSSSDFESGDIEPGLIVTGTADAIIDRMNFAISRRSLPHSAAITIENSPQDINFMAQVVQRVVVNREYRASLSQLRMTAATQFSLPMAFGHSLLSYALLKMAARLWVGYLANPDFPIRQTDARISWYTVHDDSFVFFVKHMTEGFFFTSCLVALDNGDTKFVRMCVQNETPETVNRALTVSEFYRIVNTLPWGSQL